MRSSVARALGLHGVAMDPILRGDVSQGNCSRDATVAMRHGAVEQPCGNN